MQQILCKDNPVVSTTFRHTVLLSLCAQRSLMGGWQTYSVMGQIVNILGSASRTPLVERVRSATVLQNVATSHNEWAWPVPLQICLQTEALSSVWLKVHNVQTCSLSSNKRELNKHSKV